MILGLISSNEILLKNINYYVSKDVTQIVCGCETLIDNEVIQYANSNNIELKVFPIDKTMNEKQAYNLRNEAVSDYADEFTIFWDGKDDFIKDLIDMCRLKGKKVFTVQVILQKISLEAINYNASRDYSLIRLKFIHVPPNGNGRRAADRYLCSVRCIFVFY